MKLQVSEWLQFGEIVITTLFSIAVLVTSLRSNKLAKKIDEKDNKREKSFIRENALIVYYDLILGIKDLVKLYESRIVNKQSPTPKRMFFSDEWIKNIAFLKDKLSNTELNMLYILYGDLLTIKDILESDNYEVLDIEIERLFKSIMNKNVIEYAFVLNIDVNIINIESYLNSNYFSLLDRLNFLTYTEKQIITKKSKGENYKITIENELLYSGEMKNGKYEGQGIIWGKSLTGELYERFKGKFENGVFCEGKRHEKYLTDGVFFEMKFKGKDKRIEGELFRSNGEVIVNGIYDNDMPQEGFFTIISDKGKIEYSGELKNSKYHGKGTLYENNENHEGNWERGILVNGIKKNVRVADSNGYDYYSDQSWIEHCIEEAEARSEASENIELPCNKWTEYASIRIVEYEESEIIEDTKNKVCEY